MPVQVFADEDLNYEIAPALQPASPAITRAKSFAKNRTSISFLDFPAELRNAIYEDVLLIPGTLMIIANGLYRYKRSDNQQPAQTKDEHRNWNSRALNDTNTAVENLLPRSPSDRPRANVPVLIDVDHPGIGLFLSCKQIYNETAAMFYARNSFAISRRDPKAISWLYLHDGHGAYLAEGAEWLAKMGSQLSKLNEITLNVEAICPAKNYTHQAVKLKRRRTDRYIEVLPILRVLWEREWSGAIRFQSATPEIFCRKRSHEACRSIKPDIDARAMTEALNCLRRDDLGIKASTRLMCHVALHRNGKEGFILFRSTHPNPCLHVRQKTITILEKRYHPCYEQCIVFAYTDGRLHRQPRMLEERKLPSRIRETIKNYVFHCSEIIDVDLQNDKDILPGLAITERNDLTSHLNRWYTVNQFALNLRLPTDAQQILSLDLLDRWLKRSSLISLGDPSRRAISERAIAGLKGSGVRVLRIDCESRAGIVNRLDQVKINASALMRYGYCLGDRSAEGQVKVYFRLWHIDDRNDKTIVEEQFIMLQALRASILETERVLRSTLSETCMLSDVEVIIDGCGSPVAFQEHGLDENYQLPW